MIKLVRIIGIVLLLISASLLVVRLWVSLPVGFNHLLIIFIIGAVSLMWATIRNQNK